MELSSFGAGVGQRNGTLSPCQGKAYEGRFTKRRVPISRLIPDAAGSSTAKYFLLTWILFSTRPLSPPPFSETEIPYLGKQMFPERAGLDDQAPGLRGAQIDQLQNGSARFKFFHQSRYVRG